MNIQTLEEYKRELLAEHKEEVAAIDRLIARERRQTEPSAILRKITEDFDKDTVFHEIQSQYPSFTGTPSKVARELWKRSREGELKVVQKGAGRIPAIYKKK